MSDVALHEGAHAAMCVWLQRPVSYIWRETGFALPGETKGFCMAPIEGDVGPDQLMIAVVGYMSDGRPNWPPTFEEARSERLEALGLIIKLTGIDEAAYNQFVELAEEILADPDFRRLQSTFARGVVACPLLDAEGVADLARAMGFPVTGVADAVIPDQGATPA